MNFKFAVFSDRNKGKNIPVIDANLTTAGELAKLLQSTTHDDYPNGLWGDGSSIMIGKPYWIKLESPDSVLPTGQHGDGTPLKVMVAKSKSSGAVFHKEDIDNASSQKELRDICKDFRALGEPFSTIIPGSYTRMSNNDLRKVLYQACEAQEGYNEPVGSAQNSGSPALENVLNAILKGQEALLAKISGEPVTAKAAPAPKVEKDEATPKKGIAFPGQNRIAELEEEVLKLEELFESLHERLVKTEVQLWISNEHTQELIRAGLEAMNPNPSKW